MIGHRPTGAVILGLPVVVVARLHGRVTQSAVAHGRRCRTLRAWRRRRRLLAVGRATQLLDAVDQLTANDRASEVRIEPDEVMAATYAEVRRSIPRLVAGLNAIASLFVEPATSTHHECP